MFNNDLACTANNLTAQYVDHCHVTCQTAQGLCMALCFGFGVKTLKISQWAGQGSVVYGHGIKHRAGLL